MLVRVIMFHEQQHNCINTCSTRAVRMFMQPWLSELLLQHAGHTDIESVTGELCCCYKLLYMFPGNSIMASASIQHAGAAEKQTCPAACDFPQCYQVKRGNGNNDIK